MKLKELNNWEKKEHIKNCEFINKRKEGTCPYVLTGEIKLEVKNG